MQQLLLPLEHFFPALYWSMGHIGGNSLVFRIRATLRDDSRRPRYVKIKSSSNKAAILSCNTPPPTLESSGREGQSSYLAQDIYTNTVTEPMPQ